MRMVKHHADALRGLRAVRIDAGTRDERYLDLGAVAFRYCWPTSVWSTCDSSCSMPATPVSIGGTLWHWPTWPSASPFRMTSPWPDPLPRPETAATTRVVAQRAATIPDLTRRCVRSSQLDAVPSDHSQRRLRRHRLGSASLEIFSPAGLESCRTRSSAPRADTPSPVAAGRQGGSEA